MVLLAIESDTGKRRWGMALLTTENDDINVFF